jgi:SAM-dependent methyltransferase
MIGVARSRVPKARFVAADAVTLPFLDSTFDVVTAGFVLSHLANYEAGLMEARRVLTPGGVFAMTSWAADTDAHGGAWRELLAGAVSSERLQAAVAGVVPSEARFESAAGVHSALAAGGFTDVEVHALTLDYGVTLDQFLADRELSSGGRFARHVLGAYGWAGFVARARNELERRFGSVFECSRGVLIGLGKRAG